MSISSCSLIFEFTCSKGVFFVVHLFNDFVWLQKGVIARLTNFSLLSLHLSFLLFRFFLW
jgi:hypothetical protein